MYDVGELWSRIHGELPWNVGEFVFSANTQKRSPPLAERSHAAFFATGAHNQLSNPPSVSKRSDELPMRTRLVSLATPAVLPCAAAPHCAAEPSVSASGAGGGAGTTIEAIAPSETSETSVTSPECDPPGEDTEDR
jgi:hypothetical protein